MYFDSAHRPQFPHAWLTGKAKDPDAPRRRSCPSVSLSIFNSIIPSLLRKYLTKAVLRT